VLFQASEASHWILNSVAANLYEITFNKTYLDAALLSARFIDNNMRVAGLMVNQIDVGSCGLDRAGAINSAIATRAWITLYDITQDSQWRDKRVP
jgi:uncharacterized protein YyaL (SSP411 family)